MTTLVAVRKHDEIAIAADSLTTFGDLKLAAPFDRSPEKIVHYRGTYLGLCGSAAHQLVFESLLKSREDLDFSGRVEIFDTLRKLHPVLKDQPIPTHEAWVFPAMALSTAWLWYCSASEGCRPPGPGGVQNS